MKKEDASNKDIVILGILILVILGFAIFAAVSAPKPLETGKLKDSKSSSLAPEFKDIAYWINSDALKMSDLRGKVVLIDFWTYSCINCQRTLPYLKQWYEKYHDKGLVIIGVHSPEFSFEQVKENVEAAIQKEGIKYPVAMDNSMSTWRAFQNQYWPAKYFIDKEGKIRYYHFGEGAYLESEKIIQELLGISESYVSIVSDNSGSAGQTPETYLGYERAANNKNRLVPEVATDYSYAENLNSHEWTLLGKWSIHGEFAQSESNDARIKIKFTGKELYIVASGISDSSTRVFLNGKLLQLQRGDDVLPSGTMVIKDARLYKVIKFSVPLKDQEIELVVPSGVKIHTFTFG